MGSTGSGRYSGCAELVLLFLRKFGCEKASVKALLVSSDIESVDVRRDGPLTVVEIAMKSVPDLAVSTVLLRKS